MQNEFRLVFPAVCYVRESSIEVKFPDLPGLVTHCSENNLTKAVLQAQADLTLYVCNMLDGNDIIPEPSKVHHLKYEQPDEDGVIVTLVSLDVTPLTSTLV